MGLSRLVVTGVSYALAVRWHPGLESFEDSAELDVPSSVGASAGMAGQLGTG